VERALAPSFLHFRIRDLAIPALSEGPEPPPGTVLGAFIRIVQAKMDEVEAGAELGTGFDFTSQALREAGSRPVRPAARALSARGGAGLSDQDQARAEELADLQEVMRLGRHLLEGRHVTL
jgi:hypothetical protein